MSLTYGPDAEKCMEQAPEEHAEAEHAEATPRRALTNHLHSLEQEEP